METMFKIRVNDLEIPVYAPMARKTLGQDNMYVRHVFDYPEEIVIRTFIGLVYAEYSFINECIQSVPGYLEDLKGLKLTYEHQE